MNFLLLLLFAQLHSSVCLSPCLTLIGFGIQLCPLFTYIPQPRRRLIVSSRLSNVRYFAVSVKTRNLIFWISFSIAQQLQRDSRKILSGDIFQRWIKCWKSRVDVLSFKYKNDITQSHTHLQRESSVSHQVAFSRTKLVKV